MTDLEVVDSTGDKLLIRDRTSIGSNSQYDYAVVISPSEARRGNSLMVGLTEGQAAEVAAALGGGSAVFEQVDEWRITDRIEIGGRVHEIEIVGPGRPGAEELAAAAVRVCSFGDQGLGVLGVLRQMLGAEYDRELAGKVYELQNEAPVARRTLQKIREILMGSEAVGSDIVEAVRHLVVGRRNAVELADERLQHFREACAERTNVEARLKTVVAESEARGERIMELESRRDELAQFTVELRADVAGLSTRLGERDETIEGLRDLLADREQDRDAAVKRADWNTERANEASEQLVALEGERNTLASELRRASERYNALLAASDAGMEKLDAELREAIAGRTRQTDLAVGLQSDLERADKAYTTRTVELQRVETLLAIARSGLSELRTALEPGDLLEIADQAFTDSAV